MKDSEKPGFLIHQMLHALLQYFTGCVHLPQDLPNIFRYIYTLYSRAADKFFSLGVLTFTTHHKQLCAVQYMLYPSHRNQCCFSIGFVLQFSQFGFRKYFWFSLVKVSRFYIVLVTVQLQFQLLKPLTKSIYLYLSVKKGCFLFQYSYGFFLYILVIVLRLAKIFSLVN